MTINNNHKAASKLCIIPARGGSKRIPRKNIKNFLGKPIIAYSIEAAQKSNLFNEIMVSTDDREIAEIAEQYGAKVPFMRSKENADDNATIFDVVHEVLDYYKKLDFSPPIVGCVFATAPFMNEKIIIQGLNKIEKEGFDSAFTVQKFNYPIFRALKKKENGNLEMFWDEYLNTRSQDLPDAYHDAGQFYIAKTSALLIEKSFFTLNSVGIELSNNEAIDIDTEEDWKFAETLFKILKSNS
jgi:N-acylneuraminate cytidylyltransferase